MGLFSGKHGLIMGVANDRSIAWAMSKALFAEGAELSFTHKPVPSSERRLRRQVEEHDPKLVLPCDVRNDEDLDQVFQAVNEDIGRLDFLVHSIAFAPPQELRNPYYQTSRAGWFEAMEISAYSLVAVCQRAAPLMTEGGTIVTVTYFGGEKVIPGYNLMGVCKATLEHSVRYIAWDLGRQNIRVNALSAGPMRTLSTAGLPHFEKMQAHHAEHSSLGRNVTFEELGKTGLFLLSDLSDGVTGETLHVDAGYHSIGV
jgi:enoyl-[acyl-carrier protein] reductase I